MIDEARSRRVLIYASVTGTLGVAAGAFGAHFLPFALESFYVGPETVDADLIAKRQAQFDTAVRYHQLHSVALLALVAIPFGSPVVRAWVSRLFLLGILLFSGSLYTLVFTGYSKLGMVTPAGGLSFILGWCLLMLAAKRISPR